MLIKMLSYTLIFILQTYVLCINGDGPGIKDNLHVGTSFALAFPYAYNSTAYKCEFVVTAWEDAEVHVQAKAADYDDTRKIAVSTSARYTLPCDSLMVSENTESKAVLIKSDAGIQVEVMVMDDYSIGDSFLLLPVREHSTQFIATAYFKTFPGDNWYSMVLVVPVESGTEITLYEKNNEQDVDYYMREEEVTLNQHEVYTKRIQYGDLNGLFLSSNKPVSVIAGSSLTRGIPPSYDSTIYSAIPPVSDQGYTHIVLPHAGRAEPTGYHVEVIAVEDNVAVTVSPGVETKVLNRGQMMEKGMNSPVPIVIRCSKKCLVVEYSKTWPADWESGDLFMMTVPSVSQAVSKAHFNTFLTYDNNQFTYYVSMLSTTNGSSLPEYLLDNKPLTADWQCVEDYDSHNESGPGCQYMYTSFTVSHGSHTISSVSGTRFLAWSYAYYYTLGYGTAIGMSEVNKDEEFVFSSKENGESELMADRITTIDEKIEELKETMNAKVERMEQMLTDILKELKQSH